MIRFAIEDHGCCLQSLALVVGKVLICLVGCEF